jgi:DNA adenine methylase
VSLPPFKWPGAKSWLSRVAAYAESIGFRRVVEPFAGSSAFFLASGLRKGLLVDANSKLISCLTQIRDNHESLLELLQPLENTRTHYEYLKTLDIDDPLKMAARFIYLTHTSWGGVYRENKLGSFNVPFGNNGRPCYYEDRIRSAAMRLKEAKLLCGSYAMAFASLRPTDLVFVDPPYSGPTYEFHFDRYYRIRFTWSDQQALANRLCALADRGIGIIVAGPAHKNWASLYAGWRIVEVSRSNSLTSKRGEMSRRTEVLAFSQSASEAFSECGDLNIFGR